MYHESKHSRVWWAAAASMALIGPMSGQARGDFVLFGNEHLDVTTDHSSGALWDSSSVSVLESGKVSNLSAGHFSTVDISGGTVTWLDARYFSTVHMLRGTVSYLETYNASAADISGGTVSGSIRTLDTSTVDISGGAVAVLNAWGTSTVEISGGQIIGFAAAFESSTVNISGRWVASLSALDSSTVNISGGSLGGLAAYHSSLVTFYGKAFHATGDITFDGQRVLGLGILAGQWADGTPWAVNISANDPSATILAIPEPSTLALFTIGALALLVYAWQRRRIT